MLAKQFSQFAVKFMMIIIMSQVLLMNVSALKMQPFQAASTTSISTPCPKSISLKPVANKICESFSNTFLTAERINFSFFNDQTKLFFLFVLIFAYATPIYSIYKPPKK